MKRMAPFLMILISISYMTSCTPPGHYSDSFYNYNDNDWPRNYLPLTDPYEAEQPHSNSPWRVDLMPNGPYVSIPDSNDYYHYTYIEGLEKFSVQDGVILAYSSYVDNDAEPYIQNNYYHWFIIIPNKKKGVSGFHTESEFLGYIRLLGVQNLDWQTPDVAFDKFAQTGCLDWLPDCK